MANRKICSRRKNANVLLQKKADMHLHLYISILCKRHNIEKLRRTIYYLRWHRFFFIARLFVIFSSFGTNCLLYDMLFFAHSFFRSIIICAINTQILYVLIHHLFSSYYFTIFLPKNVYYTLFGQVSFHQKRDFFPLVSFSAWRECCLCVCGLPMKNVSYCKIFTLFFLRNIILLKKMRI